MNNSVKYYIYVSDTKVDMLYPQIPKRLLQKIASELSINLKLVAAEFGTTLKSNSSEETRYSKLKVVSKYIEDHFDVGTVDAPSTYFKGTLQVRWGPITDAEEAVYFGGFTQRTILGLGGSTKHIIGSNRNSPVDIGFSYLQALSKVLAREPRTPQYVPDTHIYYAEEALLGVEVETGRMKGPQQQVEFLAKTLLQGPRQVSQRGSPPALSHVVLGTPIYVAIAD